LFVELAETRYARAAGNLRSNQEPSRQLEAPPMTAAEPLCRQTEALCFLLRDMRRGREVEAGRNPPLAREELRNARRERATLSGGGETGHFCSICHEAASREGGTGPAPQAGQAGRQAGRQEVYITGASKQGQR